ncbi:unnamed protein product, partial [marine sediment metagenome]
NNQYEMPEVDGPEAMKRVKECSAAIFLVAEANGKVVGCIRGVYDGSRALIHLLSIHPKYQKRGIGTNLVKKIIERFKKRGACILSIEYIFTVLLKNHYFLNLYFSSALYTKG